MIAYYQLQNIRTKEAVTVGKQIDCLALCLKANKITGANTFEVVPASLANINKHETFGGKTIYTVKEFSDLDSAKFPKSKKVYPRIVDLDDEADFAEQRGLVTTEEIEEISPKQRIKDYLLKMQAALPIKKAKCKNEKQNHHSKK